MSFRSSRMLTAAAVLSLAAGLELGGQARADYTASLFVGGSYTGGIPVTFNKNDLTPTVQYEGGGSIDVSKLNNRVLPFLYCLDIPDVVYVNATYGNTNVSTEAKVFYGPSNPGPPYNGIPGTPSTVPNAGSIAWLLKNYGAAASLDTTRVLQAGLQAAIWKLVYA